MSPILFNRFHELILRVGIGKRISRVCSPACHPHDDGKNV
jgi:hypothetical protein